MKKRFKKKNLSDKKIELRLANAKATVEMKGFIMPDDEVEVFRKYLEGELTDNEVLEWIKSGI